jgi:gliding motility-associated-like protein
VAVAVVQAPDAGNDTTSVLCSTSATVAMFSLLGGSPDPGGTWTDPDGNSSSGTFDPGVSLPGVYLYQVPAVANCSMDQASLNITVATAAFAGIPGDTVLCSSADPFPLMGLLGGTPDPGGTWSGPVSIPGGNFDPASDPSGTYTYTVTAPAPCPLATSTVEVTVNQVPQVVPTFTVAPGCVPVEVTFTSGYSGPGTCHWDFGNGTDTSACGPVSIIYDEPGTYTVQFTADPGNGCGVTVETAQPVQVAAQPTAAFTIVGDNVSTFNPTAAFDNESIGAAWFLWDFAGLGSSSAVDTQFTFPFDVEADYPVCLIAYATPTCTDTTCAELLVPANAAVFTPNAFSPDGDRINDDFAPVASGVDPSDYEFFIVDRWGKLVFSTRDPALRWDGNLDGGIPAPVGVYVWKLTVKDAISGNRAEYMGHVTLVR